MGTKDTRLCAFCIGKDEQVMAERRVIRGYIVERQADGSLKTIGPANGTAPQMPADPTFPYEGPKASADLTNTSLRNQGQVINNEVSAATKNALIRKAMADAAKSEADAAEAKRKADKAAGILPVDEKRRSQIKSLLDVIARTRGKADDFLAVGEQGRRAREWPLIGPMLGQNRADVEGLTASIEGDMIQQQIAILSAQNAGNGVASLANSEPEAKRLASAIANLSENQSLPEFNAGLDRAEAYYLRQLAEMDGGQDIQKQVVEGKRANANNAGGAQAQTGNNGFDRYVTEQDDAFHAKVTNLFKQKAPTSQIRQFINESGYGDRYRDADIANAVAYRDGTGRYSKQGPQPGAGFQKPMTGERSIGQQIMGSIAESPAAAYGGAALDSAMFGTLDEAVGLMGGDQRMAQYAKEYARNENPLLSLAGDVTGGFAVGGPATAGVRYAGIKGAQAASPFAARMANTFAGSVPRAAITASTLQGALTGAGQMNDNRLLGAGIGATAGLAGSALGGKLASFPSSGTATQLTNPIRGMMGGRQRPTLPQLDPSQQLMNRSVGGNFDNVLTQMDEAQNLGLPMMLADADPALRSLAGSTVRKSPDARGMAEQALMPRQRGQYDRLLGAIERDLGPTANVPQLSDDLIKKARTDSRPLYDAAYAAPGASSVDISGIIKTPIGQQGIRRAASRLQNQLGHDGQPVDPTSMGFDFDQSGELVLGRTPSFQQLDQFKQGLDDVINAGYDPISRQYTPEASQAIALKQNLVKQIDDVNPAYGAARAAYAGPASERAALQQGKDALRLPPDAMNFQRQVLGQSEQAQYDLGYRSGMVEQAGKVRYATNPWDTAYGTPQAQQKLTSLFPQNADRFGKQYGLEGQMAETNKAVIGGSPTAERLISDSNFDMGFLPTVAMDAATTGTPLLSAGRLGAKFAGGELGRIGAKKKADALAPILFDADPAKNAALVRELQKNVKIQRRGSGIFGNRARKLGAIAGGAPSVGFTLGLTE